MPASDYILALREHIGHDLILTPGVAALVPDDRGRILFILLQRRSDDGTWSLPAGAVDPGEAPAEALVREVWEETGLKVVPLELAGVFSGPEFLHGYPNGDRICAFNTVFLCRAVGGELGGRDGESLELRYVHPDDLPPSALLSRYPGALFRFTAGDTPLFRWDDAWLNALT